MSVVLGLLEYFKYAELFGSRGRARWKNLPEPEGKDWDFIVFTDDPVLIARLRAVLEQIGKVYENKTEFWVHTSVDVDLNVMPMVKRAELLRAYEHQDRTDCTKNEMIGYIDLMRITREECTR
jgi:predicted nucleotidyltransferase